MSRAPATRDLVVALHKPWGFLSQFTPDGSSHRPLAALDLPPEVWPIGRLDADSEGLLLLSSSPALSAALLDPARRHPREYWVQVEGRPDADALARLRRGVDIQGRPTRPCLANALPDPMWPPRDPPIRTRLHIPTSWLSLTLTEGRNRQVRRMTAAVGHPTLRLLRVRIGEYGLGDLAAGTWRVLGPTDIERVLAGGPRAVSPHRRAPAHQGRRPPAKGIRS